MSQTGTLLDFMYPADLIALAGKNAFYRGSELARTGAVHDLTVMHNAAYANVQDVVSYRTSLLVQDGVLMTQCGCARGIKDQACEHCIALARATVDSPDCGNLVFEKTSEAAIWADLAHFLKSQSKEALETLLLEAARADKCLQKSLTFSAQRAAGGVITERAYRRMIQEATSLRGEVAWNEARDVAMKLNALVSQFTDLLSTEPNESALKLAERAIGSIELMLDGIDDDLDGVGDDAVVRIGALHLGACRIVCAEPAVLAERLFYLQMSMPLGLHSFGPLAYRDVLQPAGLQCYRQLAQTYADRRARSGAEDLKAAGDVLTGIMEELAEAEGDIEAVVEIKSRDLSLPGHFADIVQLYRKAGNTTQALTWAERGLATFPDNDYRIGDLTAELYKEVGRHDELLALRRRQFTSRQTLESYQMLAQAAQHVGQWPSERELAIATIHGTSERRHPVSRGSKAGPDRSLLLAIALWEHDLDSAWLHARGGTCSRSLLIALADQSGATRIDDALALFRELTQQTLEQPSNQAYSDAMDVVRRMARVCREQGRESDLRGYLASLRIEFKRKRNFIKLLDEFAASNAC